jgi:quinoprotein glucose dehydrogenase
LLTGSGLLFIGATPDMKLSAYDVADGTLLWQADLDAAGYATPITYRVDGKQYVVIAAGGGLLGPPSGSTYAAFSLPD